VFVQYLGLSNIFGNAGIQHMNVMPRALTKNNRLARKKIQGTNALAYFCAG